MADRPKSDSDHAAGTYSKNSKGTPTQAGDAAAAQHENRFAEVQRKSRAARERMNEASGIRADERKSNERQRDQARIESETLSSKSALDKAAALLDGESAASDEEPS